jgi:DNA repair exonuclease SbcCD ATPase subunit
VSKAKEREAGRDASAGSWRIRTEKGEIFGPADLDTLKAWARDGRIAPSSEISADEGPWQPVTRVRGLEMDWVAEVTNGTFYGPIHRAALDELLHDGSLAGRVALFRRLDPDAAAVSPRERELEVRLSTAQQSLYARIGELEAQLTKSRAEGEQAQAAVSARDLEFDAERQELRATASRLQAELVKRDGRIAALEKEAVRQQDALQERRLLEARLADAEKQMRDLARERDQEKQLAEQARQAQREAEKAEAVWRERQGLTQRELEGQRQAADALRMRLESVRKLLQQAAGAAGVGEPLQEKPVIDIDMDAPRSGVPPVNKASGSAKPALSLVDLEAQAQKELSQLRQSGGKGGALRRAMSR